MGCKGSRVRIPPRRPLLAKAQNRKVLGFFACFAPAHWTLVLWLDWRVGQVNAVGPCPYPGIKDAHRCYGWWPWSGESWVGDDFNNRPVLGSGIRMIDGLVAGRLYGEAERRTDKSGKAYTLAKVRAGTAEGDVLFINVIAFDEDLCASLHKLRDGDSVALSGSLNPRVWTDKQGNSRPALDMVAHRVMVLPVSGLEA